MDRQRAERVLAMLDSRGQIDRLSNVDRSAERACLERAKMRLAAAQVLVDADHWEAAYTTSYDAYRTAADAIVLALGYRVPAVAGAHRIAMDVAHAALQSASKAFAPAIAERFREGRHQSEYFDPELPIEKTGDDAAWAVGCAQAAVDAVAASLSI